jgi:hypothetical protein
VGFFFFSISKLGVSSSISICHFCWQVQ